MSDFDATPIDEQASDLLDGNGTVTDPAVAVDDRAVAGRLRQFASQKAAIVDIEAPTPAVRERLIAAALAAAAPESNVVPLRRRPILAAGAGLVAAAAAASLIFVVSNRHNETRLSSTAATTAASATAGGAAPQVKAADTAAATEAASADFGASTTAAAAATTAAASSPTPAAIGFAGALAGRSYNSPQELVTAYQAARDALAAPPPSTTVSPACSFAGERIGSITYQDTPAELFVTTDSFGHAHLTALANEDCHRVIEVTVP